jgi:RNA processing factor Prp31
VTNNEDQGLTKRIEDHNRRSMRYDLSPEDMADLKRLLDKYEELMDLAQRRDEIDVAMKVHERLKLIIRSIVVGTPIIAAIWQLVDRLHK